MEPRLFNTLGKRVRILRQDLNYTQNDVVNQLRDRGVDIGRSYISTLEGSDRIPSGEVVAALADVLGTTTDYLLLRTEDSAISEEYEESTQEHLIGELAEIYVALSQDGKDTLLRVAKALRNSEPRIIE